MHWGATTVACTSSAAKGERLKALGADRVINTSEQDFVAATFELRQASRRGADVHKGVDGTTSSTFPKFESYRSVATTNNNRHSGARVTREARDKRARNP